MKLKEFSVWAYKFALSDSIAFTLENRCVCAHFERCFEGLDTKGVYRVVVKLSDGDPRDGTTEISSSVLKYYEKFDFNSFYERDTSERKKLLLDILYSSLLKVCEENGWAKEPFEIAKSRVIGDKFNNSYEVCRKKNRTRSMVASLNAKHTAERFELDIVVIDKMGKEIHREPVLSEEPDEFIFNGQVGRIQWKSNGALNYITKDKEVLKTIEFNTHDEE